MTPGMRILWRCLRHPRAQLYAFDARDGVRQDIQCSTWAWLAVIALAGSPATGACMPRAAVPPVTVHLSLILSWFVLVPALRALTRRRLSTCVHACFIAISYGVGILALGGAVNHLLEPGPIFCGAWIAFSNIAMAAALVRQFSAIGVPAPRTIAAWVLFLNGTALAIFFGAFR